MIVSGFTPLFILMAVRGNKVIPEIVWGGLCGAFVVLPLVALWLRWNFVKSQSPRQLTVGRVEDSRAHLLVYLFAILLPFYRQEWGEVRDLVALGMALGFVIFLFYHLNMHYMNILLAIVGFRIYTVHPKDEASRFENRHPIVIISRRLSLIPGDVIEGRRLSDTLYLE